MSLADTPIAVEGIGLSKSFGGVHALSEASLAARKGEVHALVGENGAGKSTLIKLLGGRIAPDTGEIRIKGQPVTLGDPSAGHRLGVWTVFQELTLLPWMTVAENLMLGREPRRGGLISRRALADQAEAMLAGMGINHVDPLAAVEDIPLAERQVVEIVRALSHDPEILFLDEPTSSLVEREVAWLFARIRDLRARGTAIVFTSHRWGEIASIADRITVFRGGRHVGTFEELDEDRAVTLMTGQRVEQLYPPVPAMPQPVPALQVRGLAAGRLRGVDLTLHRGEVLGIGGLAGHGHRELFFSLFGAMRAAAGTIEVEGRTVRVRNPRDAMRHGVALALVPEDRKTEGLMLRMSVRDNMTLSVLRRLSRFGMLRLGAERSLAQGIVTRLKVRTPGLADPVGALSGGNQQKVLVGRWLLAEPRILLLYDVTRGVDVATKHDLYELMLGLAAEGRSILYYSSDAEELAHLCHRVLVLREGRIAAELRPPGLDAEQIVAAAVRETVAA
jgi:ribose transport system ATP-binding protein